MPKKFLNDTSGAVTIDWVALAAGVLLVGITVIYSIYTNGIGDLTSSLNSAMKSIDAGINTGAVPSQDTFSN
ncbi:MAG: hypothetical protein AAF557_11320 [Pseudomonadota bacterium]